MKFLNSIIARIWGPFGLMAVSLLLLVGIYIPNQQKGTLREFQSAELKELVKSMAINISVAGKYDDWTRLTEIFADISERPSLEFAVLLLEFNGKETLVASNPPNVSMEAVRIARSNDLFVEAPIEGGIFQGKVVILGSEAFLSSETARLNFPLVVAMALVITAVILLYFFFLRGVALPLQAVQGAAERIREGDLSKPVDIDTNIRELKSMNMALDGLRNGLLEQRNTNLALTKGMENEIQRQTKDLRKTLDELQDSRNLFGNIIESALDAMVIADGQSRIVEWNRKAEQIFGWSREEALGQKLTKLIIPQIHRDNHDKGMSNYHATGQGPALNNLFETQALRRDGTTFDIELYITTVKIGKEEVFSSFIRDITAAKQMSQDLERQRELNSALLNGLPMLITLKDEDLRYTFVNDSALKELKQNRSDMIGKRENEVFDTDWVEDSMKRDRAVWNGETDSAEEKTLTRGGVSSHFLIGRYLISVGKENPTSYLLTYGFDISTLKAVQKELESALSTKNEFLATVSHEIRTPLHSIIVLSELLNQHDRIDERDEFSQNIRSSSRHLLNMVNDILDFSKASAQRLELAPADMDVTEFTDGLIRVDKDQRSSEVSFIKDIQGCEGVTVHADQTRLNQVLQNLLSNAFKFTEKGEVKLQIIGVRKNDTFSMKFAVSDTGIGISNENKKKVLTAFDQGNSGIARKFGGTGLGLGIVSKLLQLMDSELVLESQLNEGTTFRFEVSFPLIKQQASASPTAHTAPATFQSIKMLYVEDMHPNQMVMKAMCKPWNVDLTIASSGQEAIERCKQESFDVVLLDIQMPEMDGIEAIKVLQTIDNFMDNTPVHAFTAHAESEDYERFLNLGFSGVLTKPLTPDQLREFLLTHLKHEHSDRH